MKRVFSEYGTVALVLYFVIFVLVFAGAWLALQAGWTPSGAAGTAGTVAAAYIITKLAQPLRIAATVVLTPVVARVYERIRGARGSGGPP